MLEYFLNCPSKINLTLRITGTRENGLHNIGSLFFRLPSIERLTFRFMGHDNVRKDIVRVHGQLLAGKNILESVLEVARKKIPSLPAIEIDLWKEIPPGSGLGSGSGNAAALACWLGREWHVGYSKDDIASFGSDVPFLFEGEQLSFRAGTGDIEGEKIPDLNSKISVMIIVPKWISVTREAYMLADNIYHRSGWPMSTGEALQEARNFARLIEKGDKIGLMPNDFLPVLLKLQPSYEIIFSIAEKSSACAWGVSGSGSSVFLIYKGGIPAGEARDLWEGSPLVAKIIELG